MFHGEAVTPDGVYPSELYVTTGREKKKRNKSENKRRKLSFVVVATTVAEVGSI
jgi:hypothetical protein